MTLPVDALFTTEETLSGSLQHLFRPIFGINELLPHHRSKTSSLVTLRMVFFPLVSGISFIYGLPYLFGVCMSRVSRNVLTNSLVLNGINGGRKYVFGKKCGCACRHGLGL